jgi:hypothetical protein
VRRRGGKGEGGGLFSSLLTVSARSPPRLQQPLSFCCTLLIISARPNALLQSTIFNISFGNLLSGNNLLPMSVT